MVNNGQFIYTALFMFKIGEFLRSVQDPLMNSHWLSQNKPIKDSKNGGQIQLVLLTYLKNNRYID